MTPVNVLYAQSGGVTAVINATAAGVIRAARAVPADIGQVLAARHGIVGALEEHLVDTGGLTDAELDRLALTPGGAFGSCRFDLRTFDQQPELYARLFAVFAAHRIGAFLYNGGNGSMDTVAKLAVAAEAHGYPLCSIGIPKTIDNDIEGTDCSPGFGSAAKYLATSVREAGLDLASMTDGRGRVFIMEVMGRNAGWLAAATALAAVAQDDPPHLILLPEVVFNEAAVLKRVQTTVERLGYCVLTVSEGIRHADGRAVALRELDAQGYVQLGGAGQYVAQLLNSQFGYKCHYAVPDYLQRAAGHWRSATDFAQAQAVGAAAIDYVRAGRSGVMASIVRRSDQPYDWAVEPVEAARIANLERGVPSYFIAEDGLHVTAAARDYLCPLIAGEVTVPATGGMPDYLRLDLPGVAPVLPAYSVRS